ncbi:hypothetical protein KCP75_11180 [Salmonella enterica subsp. enterica]|nr:hypothetical protein KCP75_11180 [Salmonella enterica subsp. enterica]
MANGRRKVRVHHLQTLVARWAGWGNLTLPRPDDEYLPAGAIEVVISKMKIGITLLSATVRGYGPRKAIEITASSTPSAN